MHFGENQLSPGSLGISPLTAAHPRLLQQTSVRPSTSVFRPLRPGHGEITRFRVDPARLRRPFGLAFAAAPPVPGLTPPRWTTRRLILQKARRHRASSRWSAPTGRERTVSGSLSLPSPGCFSPFPHGTGSLSVAGGIQPWGVVAPASTPIPRVGAYSRSLVTRTRPSSPTGLSPSATPRSSGLRLTAASPARPLPRPPPDSSNPGAASPAGCAAAPVWAPPRSLAATGGILSAPRGTKMFQVPRFPSGSRRMRGRAPRGLPHSDTSGSQAASASPERFAAWPRPSSAASA